MNDVAVQNHAASRRIALFVMGSVIVLGAAFVVSWLVGRSLRGPQAGMVLQAPTPAKDFQLVRDDGRPAKLSDFRGKVVLVYFGYTTCPDVCPTMLAEVHQAMKLLGDKSNDVQVIMVSVDPDRDSQQVLSDYMKHFDMRFIGLTGTKEQISEAATAFGVHFEKRKAESALGYLVDHTATLMLVDRQGYLKLVFPNGTKADKLADDVRYVLSR